MSLARLFRTMNRENYEFRAQLGHSLRVGGIDYLNSRPLVETFDAVAGAEVELFNLPPSELARRLRAGLLDVALVPVAEYFTAPARARYRVVPGLGISSFGAVESIRLFFRRPLGEVRRVGLDQSSMTSVLLTRLLFAERPDARWRALSPPPELVFEGLDPDAGLALLERKHFGDDDIDGVLLIGDAALQANAGLSSEWKMVDLGLEWTRWLGLPFVYAFWVHAGDAVEGVVECLHAVYRSGLASIDSIVASGPLPTGMSASAARHYLGQVLRYRLTDSEIRGIREFVRRLSARGLIGAETRELDFLDEPSFAL